MKNPGDVCYFGMVEMDNITKSFGMLREDRSRHTYILGKSGVGKSTLLENMILQDIYAGNGVAFIDPLGDSAEAIIDRIPNYRLKDVVYFNPYDVEFPIGVNMLEAGENEPKHLIASNLMSVMQRLWAGTWSARMEYILNNTILALLDTPGNSLLGVMKMYSDKQFRKFIVDQTDNLIVKSFWENEYPSFSENYRNEAIAAIRNKVGQFFASKLIRNMVGQLKSTINFREIMDGQKIFIANLSKGRLGEDNSNFLGSILVTKLQLAAMSRVDIPESQRKDFYLYVDEFQNVINDSFATILSEARKYRLNLIIAHQYLRQLEDENGKSKIKDAVFGNVGTMIVFQVGVEDAELLAKQFSITNGNNEPAEVFLNLDRGQIITKLFVQSKSLDAFSANTLPPLYTDFTGSRQYVQQYSRQQFSRPQAEVEAEIEGYLTQSIIPTETGEIMRARVPKRKRKPKPEGETNSSAPQNSVI